MGVLGAVLVLLLLAAVPGQASQRSTPAAGCPTTCGGLSFGFPFGVGPGCFRHPEFELICRNDTLLLSDGVTEVVEDIEASKGSFGVVFTYAIQTRPSVDRYDVTWRSPGGTFRLAYSVLNITGSCGFDTYLLPGNGSKPVRLCPDGDDRDAESGYCLTQPPNPYPQLHLQFVRRQKSNQSSICKRNTINVTTDDYATMLWSMSDGWTCADEANNACDKNHTTCGDDTFNGGYWCACQDGYVGNPYRLGGCSRDHGYNPAEPKANCSRLCGNVSVPFPFGIEDGCSARKIFRLNCVNTSTSSTLKLDDYRQVTNIQVNEGFMGIQDSTYDEQQVYSISQYEGNSLYVGYGESTKLQWAVANLTCEEARQNMSTYACASINSTCLRVNSRDLYVGYRCKCIPGFTGNPYVRNGCEDIDECKATPRICEGKCHNTIGHYYCTSTKRQNTLLGIAIGLGAGLGLLLLILSTVLLVYIWRRDMQNKLRRNYFKKNHGILLQQLISSDENARDRTEVFLLEELKRATNNFDQTRVIGRGGHGMVYKGILSDQRVVAIKKSNIIKQEEIEEFINEVVILTQINHRNIVKLFGCCLETEVPLLVYDFVSNGSLSEILHSGPSNSLSWDDCLRIAAEAAGALYYLHAAASISVFHRDVKSSNILLDASYTAKVSDFGASRLVPIDQTHVSTNVQGTFGYLDPEYYHTRQLNEKSDVYSFGVLLLELLLGKKPILTSESGSKQSLSNYFLCELKKRPVKEIVGGKVHEEATEEEIDNVASLAEMCLKLRGEERPTMKEVEMTLQLLLSKRSKSHHASPENVKDAQSSLHIGAEVGDQSRSSYTVNPISENSQRCYNLELEFMSSARLPR